MGELLSAGQFDVAPSIYSHTVDNAAEKGAPVAWKTNGKPVEPVVLRPNGAGLMKSAKHPAAAMLFFDFLLTDGQQAIAGANRIGAIPTAEDPLAGVETVSVPEEDLLDNAAEVERRLQERDRRGRSGVASANSQTNGTPGKGGHDSLTYDDQGLALSRPEEAPCGFIEEWRSYQKTVVALEDVTLYQTARGTRVGVYVGADGDRPTRSMDALVHEVDPGVVSTIHRHSWDAMVLVVAGNGWTEIDGERIDWGPGDSLHLPAWAWHRSGNDGDRDRAIPDVLQ